MAEFRVITRAEELVDYILDVTDKSPKRVRLDITPEIRKYSLSILENIIRANCNPVDGNGATDYTKAERQKAQARALIDIRILESLCEVACMHKYITNKQLNYITQLTYKLYNSIDKWAIGDRTR